jgi:hypothetical protein
MKQGPGKVSKTNLGKVLHEQQQHHGAGQPNLDEERLATGTIQDIRLPSEDGNYGILVKVQFDLPSLATDTWLFLKDSYQSILMNYGNRQGVLKTPPRVLYHYNPVRFEDGYAEIICDNKQATSFKSFEKNKSGNFVAVFSGLKRLGRFPGG